jgi:hypothetical protein
MIAMALERPEVAALLTGAFEGLCERYGVRPPKLCGASCIHTIRSPPHTPHWATRTSRRRSLVAARCPSTRRWR